MFSFSLFAVYIFSSLLEHSIRIIFLVVNRILLRKNLYHKKLHNKVSDVCASIVAGEHL